MSSSSALYSDIRSIRECARWSFTYQPWWPIFFVWVFNTLSNGFTGFIIGRLVATRRRRRSNCEGKLYHRATTRKRATFEHPSKYWEISFQYFLLFVLFILVFLIFAKNHTRQQHSFFLQAFKSKNSSDSSAFSEHIFFFCNFGVLFFASYQLWMCFVAKPKVSELLFCYFCTRSSEND